MTALVSPDTSYEEACKVSMAFMPEERRQLKHLERMDGANGFYLNEDEFIDGSKIGSIGNFGPSTGSRTNEQTKKPIWRQLRECIFGK